MMPTARGATGTRSASSAWTSEGGRRSAGSGARSSSRQSEQGRSTDFYRCGMEINLKEHCKIFVFRALFPFQFFPQVVPNMDSLIGTCRGHKERAGMSRRQQEYVCSCWKRSRKQAFYKPATYFTGSKN